MHDVLLKQAECSLAAEALADESTGITADLLKVHMDFENFLLASRTRSEERGKVEVAVTDVDFDLAWETLRAIKVGSLRFGSVFESSPAPSPLKPTYSPSSLRY